MKYRFILNVVKVIMMQFQNKNRIVAVLAAISIVLGVMENFLPFPIPFVRLGLSNIGIVIGVYLLDLRYLLFLGGLKSVVTAIFSTGFIFRIVIAYPSLLISIFIMYLFYKFSRKYSTALSISALGSVVNMVLQFLIIKILFIKNLAFLDILPYFLLISFFTGIFIGLISNSVLNKILVGRS
ncbi:MAG: Gx transporter family protein [Deferribacterales bacterium]